MSMGVSATPKPHGGCSVRMVGPDQTGTVMGIRKALEASGCEFHEAPDSKEVDVCRDHYGVDAFAIPPEGLECIEIGRGVGRIFLEVDRRVSDLKTPSGDVVLKRYRNTRDDGPTQE